MTEQTESIKNDAEHKQGPTQQDIKAQILEATHTCDLARLSELLKLIWHRQQSFKRTPTSILDSYRGQRTPGTSTYLLPNPPKEWSKFIEDLEQQSERYEAYTTLYRQCQKAQRIVQRDAKRQQLIDELEHSITLKEVV